MKTSLHPLPDEIRQQLISDRKVRVAVTRRDPILFMDVYMPEVISYAMAPMHYEMFEVIASTKLELACIMAFRSSGKSTLLTLVYPIWGVIGAQQKKFVVIFSKTQDQARILLEHIKRELETNQLLRDEMGPFESYEDKWGVSSIVLSRYGARITAASVDQSVRGIRHGKYRPDLIILDDTEDQQSVRTNESREKLAKWFAGEVVPLGDTNTKIVLVGNKLHQESLIMKVAGSIKPGDPSGIARTYPIMDENGVSLWPAKFPTPESIEKRKRQVNDHVIWMREFMQEIISEEDQLIKPEDIHYYAVDQLPRNPVMTITSVDLASSQKESAAKSAILTSYVYGAGAELKFYLVPTVTNDKLTFRQIIQRLQAHMTAFPGRLVVESVGAQEYVPQELRDNGFAVDSWKPNNDKYNRLYSISNLIATGAVLFPETGCETLITQLLEFGTEQYKDLVDALTMLVLFVQQQRANQGAFSIGTHNLFKRRPGQRVVFSRLS